MKTISPALTAHLAQDTTTLCTAVKITRRDGLILGYTTHDKPLTMDVDGLGPLTYTPVEGYKRSAIASQLGLSTDNVDLEGLLDDEALTDQDLLNGLYDGADVKFMLLNWSDLSQGILKLRRGLVGQVTLHRNTYVAEIRGLMDWYSQVIGELYTPDCRADLGDSRCTVDMAPFRVATTVASVTPADYTFTVAIDGTPYQPVPADGSPWFAGGAVLWTSGANVGVRAEIKAWLPASATVTLFLPPTFPVAVGDELTLEAGCDKRLQTCIAKFANVVNFRGEAYLPGLNKMLDYPNPHTVR